MESGHETILLIHHKQEPSVLGLVLNGGDNGLRCRALEV